MEIPFYCIVSLSRVSWVYFMVVKLWLCFQHVVQLGVLMSMSMSMPLLRWVFVSSPEFWRFCGEVQKWSFRGCAITHKLITKSQNLIGSNKLRATFCCQNVYVSFLCVCVFCCVVLAACTPDKKQYHSLLIPLAGNMLFKTRNSLCAKCFEWIF